MKNDTDTGLKDIKRSIDETNNLLRTSMIIQLGLSGVPQKNIRDIVGGDIKRVNNILKNVKPKE